MIDEWNVYKGWSVLEYFLLNPNTKTHIKELSRKIAIGPNTAQKFCKNYAEEGLLKKTEIGNVHQFYLNEDDARIRDLKIFIGSYLMADRKYITPFIQKNKNILSIAIYGSFASGNYTDNSDLDILILTSDEKKPDTKDLAKISLKLGREIGITVINLARWRRMEREKDYFFLSIKRNNKVIWGGSI